MNLTQTIWRAEKWQREIEQETGKDHGYWKCLGYFRGNADTVRAFLEEADHDAVRLEQIEPRDVTLETVTQIKQVKEALGNAVQALDDIKAGL